jgi:hypothetical protein
MTAIAKLITLLLFAAFALVATAAPHRSEGNTIQRRTPAPIPGSPTRDAPAPVCTNGLPASKQHPAGYPINNYTVVTPDDNNWTSYTIEEDWYGHHFVSGPHVSPSSPVGCQKWVVLTPDASQIMNFNHKSDPYGPFKCQYTCNAKDNCSAYFVWYGKYTCLFDDGWLDQS